MQARPTLMLEHIIITLPMLAEAFNIRLPPDNMTSEWASGGKGSRRRKDAYWLPFYLE